MRVTWVALAGLLVFGVTGADDARASAAHTGCVVPGGGPVVAAPPRAGKVSVTFDESLGSLTGDILNAFRRERMTGTFYAVGAQVRDHRALSREIAEEGHEVGNHSYNHTNLTQLDDGGYENLRRARRAITRITGFRPCTMRPPYLATSAAVTDAARSLGMRTVLATRGNDIFGAPAHEICSYALDRIRSGDIILMHQIERSAEALSCVLAGLRDRGLRSVPVAKLLGGSWLRGTQPLAGVQRRVCVQPERRIQLPQLFPSDGYNCRNYS